MMLQLLQVLKKGDKEYLNKCEKIYNFLKDYKIDVLFDDTEDHLSAKFKKI